MTLDRVLIKSQVLPPSHGRGRTRSWTQGLETRVAELALTRRHSRFGTR